MFDLKYSHIPVFILAGGLGTRISEETQLKPKPMVEIGEYPILLHLMKYYYRHGFNDFVICAGYKSWVIKEFFLNYEFRCNSIEIDHRASIHSGPLSFQSSDGQENWRVRVVDTGIEAMTGARVARAFDLVSAKQSFADFAVTYGDGLSDIDLAAEFRFHEGHAKIGTILGVTPTARFGELEIGPDNMVEAFLEKPASRQALINGGFFFFKKAFREYLSLQDNCILERDPLERLARHREMMLFKHTGFWQPMDTLRDRNQLTELWESGKAPWIIK